MKNTMIKLAKLWMPAIVLSPAVSVAALTAGDLAVIEHSLDDSSFRIIALDAIVAGEIIKITDRGWVQASDSFGAFGTNEGTLTWVVQSTIAAGSTFEFHVTDGGVGGSTGSVSLHNLTTDDDLSAGVSTVGWDNFTFNTAGDQLMIYQGDDSSPNFVYTFNNSGNNSQHDSAGEWQSISSTFSGSNLSHLPSGVSSGLNELSFSTIDGNPANARHADNLAYNGAIDAATKEEWLARFKDYSSWLRDDIAEQVGSISDIAGGTNATVDVVPEPSSVSMFLSALLYLIVRRKR